MDIAIMIIGAFCVFLGVLGSLIPILPGTPISYVGMLLLLLVDGCSFSTTFMLVILGLVILQQVLNYVIPIWGVKKYGGSKAGQWGGVIGLLLGLLFMPWGIILGPFAGAVIPAILRDLDSIISPRLSGSSLPAPANTSVPAIIRTIL